MSLAASLRNGSKKSFKFLGYFISVIRYGVCIRASLLD